MVHGPTRNSVRRWLGLIVLGMAAALLPLPASRGADLDKVAPSLQWIPEDAATYSVMLRNREQIEILLKSKAWAKFKELPFVQSLWSKAKEQLEQSDGPVAEARKFFEEPENRQLLDLLADMASDEIFFYGGPSSADFSVLMARYQNQVQIQQMILALKQIGQEQNQEHMQAKAYLDALVTMQDRIKVPDVVVGFRVKDTARAEAQLRRLETLLKDQIAQQAPQLKDRFQRAQVGKASFLTLNLDGKLIPWDELPLKDLEEKPGQYDALVKKLTQLKVTIGLGVQNQYVLLSLGASLDPVKRLFESGKETKRLASRPEFEPLAKHLDKRITNISYMSKAISAAYSTSAYDPQNLLKTVQEAFPQANLPERQRTQIKKDMEELAKDLKKLTPEPGAMLQVAYLTSQGSESYTYYGMGKPAASPPSKPLTLLHHIGGHPLLASVRHARSSLEDYQLMVKWLKVINRYVEDLLVPHLEAEQKELYEKVTKAAYPLLQKLDEVNTKMLWPALANGQGAFVLDGKLTSKQWLKMLPPSEKPLPMLEPALVLSVNDAALLRKAMTEYRNLANQALAKGREIFGEEFPELQIPAPETKKGKAGELFFYSLPEAVPLDPQIKITLGLNPKVAVIAISQSHTDRLLADTPPQIHAGPLADMKRPLESVVYADWAGLITVISPWVEMGMQTVEPFVRIAVGEAAGKEDLATQTRNFFNILKVFRHTTSATYFENGRWVTHSESIIKDL
jgi:hypothetical protein